MSKADGHMVLPTLHEYGKINSDKIIYKIAKDTT